MPATTKGPARPGLVAAAAVVLALLVAVTGCGSDVGTTAGESTTVMPRGTGTAPPPRVPEPGSIPGTVPTVAAGTSSTTAAPSTASSTTTPSTSSSTTPTSAPSPTGPTRDLPVASTTVALIDASRPTVSRGRQIAATRTLTTTVTYPTTGGPYPLVVFAHGYQLGPSHYTQIMRAVAAGGYIVAAPSFPLADAAVGGANIDRGDIPNQSGDLAFVITQLSGASGSTGVLAGKIDAGRVGAFGHSDGADTVLDLGYYPGRTDGRVRAVAAVSPDAMTGAGGSVGSAPLLVAHGDRDSIVPFSNATAVFGQVQARRFLLTLIGADHLPPAQGAAPWAAVLDRSILELFDHHVAGRSGDDGALIAGGSVAGVASLRQAG